MYFSPGKLPQEFQSFYSKKVENARNLIKPAVNKMHILYLHEKELPR